MMRPFYFIFYVLANERFMSQYHVRHWGTNMNIVIFVIIKIPFNIDLEPAIER